MNRPVLRYHLCAVVDCLDNAHEATIKGRWPGDLRRKEEQRSQYVSGDKGFIGMSFTRTELRAMLEADGMTVGYIGNWHFHHRGRSVLSLL